MYLGYTSNWMRTRICDSLSLSTSDLRARIDTISLILSESTIQTSKFQCADAATLLGIKSILSTSLHLYISISYRYNTGNIPGTIALSLKWINLLSSLAYLRYP